MATVVSDYTLIGAIGEYLKFNSKVGVMKTFSTGGRDAGGVAILAQGIEASLEHSGDKGWVRLYVNDVLTSGVTLPENAASYEDSRMQPFTSIRLYATKKNSLKVVALNMRGHLTNVFCFYHQKA